jgi:uncharacterized protein YbaA (DUF1428 family)
MAYVDGFVIPMPKKNVKSYQKMAAAAGKVWREHGALEYRECIADQLVVDDGKGKKVAPFPKMTRTKPSETVAFSWIVYKSRAHRDAVNKKVMKDPRIAKMMAGKKMPFDMKRMAYAGFKTIVDM